MSFKWLLSSARRQFAKYYIMLQFKAGQLWSTRVSESGEQFDGGHLCVCNNEESTGGDKLVIASMEGVLRIYLPRAEPFSPEHLVVERDLGEPIVQITTGRVVSGSAAKHLVVLHPHRLIVYNLSQVSSLQEVEQGAAVSLSEVYQHRLKRTAANMCVGSFGGVKNREFICVQSLDGVLSVYEQDLFAFSRFLPNVLLPGPLSYCKIADCLLNASSSRMLMCYRYTGLALASAADARQSAGGQHAASEASGGKRLSPDWSVDLGEHIREIFVVESDSARIMVLGQRSLFCLSLDGTIQFAKKLESPPSCFKPYATKPVQQATGGDKDAVDQAPKIMTMIAFRRHHTLAILEDTRLAWAAGLPADAAVGLDIMQIANSAGVTKGVIVTLEDDGRVACLFLGTESLEGAHEAMSVRRQEDMKKHEEDLKQLRSFIRATEENKNKDELRKMVCTDLTIHGEMRLSTGVPSKEILSADSELEEAVPQKCAVLSLVIETPEQQAVHDVAITVRCQAPLVADPPGIVVSHITPENPSTLEFCFYVFDTGLVSDNKVVVVASFTSATGYPNMLPQTYTLPLALFVEGVTPEIKAQCKITIDTNQPCASLHELFCDVSQSQDVAQNSVAFRFASGHTVSVLSSRTSNRYRIQCNDFPPIWLVLSELVDRLYQQFAGIPDAKGNQFSVSLKENLPLADYYALMDEHLQGRFKLTRCMHRMEERATEFRVLQKRLLLRIKDKTPSPLHHFEMLHSRSFDLLMMICNEEEVLRGQVQEAARRLSAGTRAMNLLIRLYAGLPEEQVALLEAVLSPLVPEATEPMGWQELTDAAIVQMLKTCLSLNEREQDVAVPRLDAPESNGRLKKHLSLFIVRLSKEGLSLNVEGNPPNKATGKKADKALSEL